MSPMFDPLDIKSLIPDDPPQVALGGPMTVAVTLMNGARFTGVIDEVQGGIATMLCSDKQWMRFSASRVESISWASGHP